jgi:hypothetical protein
MAKAKKRSRPGSAIKTQSVLAAARAALERSEGPFYEGMKLIKSAQRDFERCAKNQNLYSHALRAVRHIARQSCESADVRPKHADCEAAIAAGAAANGERCWPCFARDALRRGGDKP